MSSIDMSITQQDDSLLDLIASAEATDGARDEYASVNPNSEIPDILDMTIAELLAWQERRPLNQKAAGRYQFMPPTLRETAESALGGREALSQYRFTATVQDFLIVKRLEFRRQLNEWKAGSISDEQFSLNLAREFAGLPVPEAAGRGQRNQSYYQDDSAGNGSKLNIDFVLQQLADIRTGGPGSIITRESETSRSRSRLGGSIREQVARTASGGDRLIYDHNNRGIANENLPEVSDPYIYRPIDPLDNRYDFRTGEKVRDMAYNGTLPQSAVSGVPGNGLILSNIGEEPIDADAELPPLRVVGNSRPDGSGIDLVEITLPNGNTQVVPANTAAALTEQRRSAQNRPAAIIEQTETEERFEWDTTTDLGLRGPR